MEWPSDIRILRPQVCGRIFDVSSIRDRIDVHRASDELIDLS
jgi:hypothetical protein